MCDFGHHWTLFVDVQIAEKKDDGLCPVCVESTEAVMLKKCPVANEVQITIRPASRIVDRVKQQIALRGKYYIIISDISESWHKVSEKTYSWNETMEIIRNFAGVEGEMKQQLEKFKEFMVKDEGLIEPEKFKAQKLF